MSVEKPWIYTVEIDDYSTSTSGEYLGVPLPEDIEEIGAKPGKYLEISAQTGDDNHIRATPQEKNSAEARKIQERSDRSPKYFVSLPKKLIEYSNSSPFKDVENGEVAYVEIRHDPGDEHLRFYRMDDYEEREDSTTPRFKKPIALALLSSIPLRREDHIRVSYRFKDKETGENVEVDELRIKPEGEGEDAIFVENNVERVEAAVTEKGNYIVKINDDVYEDKDFQRYIFRNEPLEGSGKRDEFGHIEKFKLEKEGRNVEQ